MLLGAWNTFKSFFPYSENRKRPLAQCNFSDDNFDTAKRIRRNENTTKDRIHVEKMAGIMKRTSMELAEPDVITIDDSDKEVMTNNFGNKSTKEPPQIGISKENDFLNYQGVTKPSGFFMDNKDDVIVVSQRSPPSTNFSNSSTINGARPKIRHKYLLSVKNEKCNGGLRTFPPVFDTIFSKSLSKANINGYFSDQSSFTANNFCTTVNRSTQLDDKEIYRDMINRFSNTSNRSDMNCIKIDKLSQSISERFRRMEPKRAIPVIDLTLQNDKRDLSINSPEIEIIGERFSPVSLLERSKLPISKQYIRPPDNGFLAPLRNNIETITIQTTPKKQILQDKKLENNVKFQSSSERHITEDRLGDHYLYESRYLKGNYFANLKHNYDSSNKVRDDQINEQISNVKKLEEKRTILLQDRINSLYSFENFKSAIEEEPFPELTPEIMKKIDEAFMVKSVNEILVEAFNYPIRRKDMETLKGLNWLNDEIINFYFTLLMERGKLDNFLSVYSFTTFFYPKLLSSGHAGLKRWTRKVDLFSYDLILIPVHLGMHWCLAVVNFRRKAIEYYDSMGGTNQKCLEAIKKYLDTEYQVKKNTKFDFKDWKLENIKDIPQQMNGSDCGMFACKYAEYVSRNVKITFKQEDMPYFRKRMVYEILTIKLM